MPDTTRAAHTIARCRELARITDVAGETTRLFLSEATKGAHALVSSWMMRAGLHVRMDDTGTLHGSRPAAAADAPTLLFFSHLDTVPNAGAFDGPLGVLLPLTVLEELGPASLPFHIEIVAFSEEEGIRFAFPFFSSLAATGQLTEDHLARTDAAGITLQQALQHFGLNPALATETAALPPNTRAAIEVHIEQGPVLEADDKPLAIVSTVIGQSRLRLTFTGEANHAGTTPMPLRRDALVAAAEWIAEVSRFAAGYKQLVATVGKVEVLPGAVNVVPGIVTCTLDVRHPADASRHAAVAQLLTKAEHMAASRGVRASVERLAEQASVPMDPLLTEALAQAAARAGYPADEMFSGAGHDSMILAPHVPTTMLFVRSPGGRSHHPDETVLELDVEAAIATLIDFIQHSAAVTLTHT